MTDERMGKVLLLRRIREEADRRAAAGASAAEGRALELEASAAADRAAASEARSRAQRERRTASSEAQIIQLRSRFAHRLRVAEDGFEVLLAERRRERIDAANAADRARSTLAASRRGRELLEARWAAARSRARRRAEEREAEQAQEDGAGRRPGEGNDE